jgi:integrase
MRFDNPVLEPGNTEEYHTPQSTEPSRGTGGWAPTAWTGLTRHMSDTQQSGAALLTEVVEQYLSERDCCRNYRRHLQRTAEMLRSIGLTSVADICPQRINRWLDGLACSKQTKSNYRRQACTIVRAALGSDAAHCIDRIRRVKAPVPPPVAWTREEMSRLLHHARNLQGHLMSGCPASLFFAGWVLLSYESGLRFSDALHLRSNQIRDGRLYTIQSKTGDPLVRVLSHDCAKILTELSVRGNGRTFFRAHLAERWLRVHFARICRKAGVSGTPKFLRRTGATMVEANQPGMAGRFLGHLSHGLAEKHYIDKTLLPNACPVPPQLQ